MKLNRNAGIIILAIIIVLAIAIGFMPGPEPVSIAKVTKGYMSVAVEEEGKTRVRDRYVVSAPVSGYILRINLDVGDKVAKGDSLVEIEPLRSNILDPRRREEAKATIAAADSALQSARENVKAVDADAEYARKEMNRITSLFEEGLVSREMLDTSEAQQSRTEAALRSAKFKVDVVRYEKEAALTALKNYEVKTSTDRGENVRANTPVTGSILKLYHESEGAVVEGEPLIEVGDPSALEVEVDVLSADAVKIRPGIKVLFERWGGDGKLEGRVRVIEPAGFTKISALGVEEQRVLVITDIVSPYDEWSRLGDGYRVEASFVIWEKEDALQVPASSLFRYKEGWAVFTIQNKRALLKEVELGHRNGLVAEIISGLSEGYTVITHPDSAIEEGIRVKLRN